MSAASVIEWAAQTGLAISLLVLFILIIRRPFARYFGPQAAYALWSIPVIRLFLPEMNIPIFKSKTPEIIPNIEAVIYGQAGPLPALVPASETSVNWPQIIIGAWLGIAALWFVYQLLNQSIYMNSLRERTNSAHSLASKIDNAATLAGLKITPEVRLAPDNSGPMVTGIGRPLIVLPNSFSEDYSSTQQHFALLHEFTHIRRKDLWISLVALVFRAINWPNPLIHYAAYKFRADQEAACDAAVLRLLDGTQDTAHGYAETLIHAAKNSKTDGIIQPLGLTIHHPIKERLMTLSNPKSNTGKLARLAAASAILTVLAASAPLTLAANHPGEKEVEVDLSNKSKQIIKWSEKDDNGNETSKHYEIVTEDGDVTAYEIDAFGNKTVVDVNEIKSPHHNLDILGAVDGKSKVRVLRMGDGNPMGLNGHDDVRVVLKKLTIDDGFAFGEDTEFPKGLMREGEERIVKRLSDGKTKVFTFSSDENMKLTSDGNGFVFGGGGHTKSLVTAAESILARAETDELSSNARKKLEKARKALEEARIAVEADSR